MPFETNAGRQNGYYGKYQYDSNTKQYQFHSLGREILLDGMTENLETKNTTWTLSFEFNGTKKTADVPRKGIADSKVFLANLADIGADVTPKNFPLILDTLRQQQEQIELQRGVKRTYERLGWISLKDYDNAGHPVWKHCYRGSKLIGGNMIQATYSGPHMVKPSGNFGVWKQGVTAEVIGHTPLELILLAGLSAVVNGLIAPQTTGENPIFHINGISGSGKTTGLELAVSVSGAPFQGSFRERTSLLTSWGATGNALIKRCEGNRGAVVALNEIGKCQIPDMTMTVYNMSEGTDKERLTTDLNARRSETFFTVFVSTGEISLLERCKSKAEGLTIRVLEITDALTGDAAHADRIKVFCRNNYGHAAPMLAQYIIDNGGLDYVLPIYQRYCQELVDKFPKSRTQKRFIEKFPALLLTTAELASAALGISFDTAGILDYLVQYAKAHSGQDNSRDSYAVIIEECRKNINCFYKPSGEAPRGMAFGKVSYPKKVLENGQIIAEEYAVRKSYVDSILSNNGFQNKRTCVNTWKQQGVLDCDGDRPTRSRKIVPGGKSEDVYVFRVYADPSDNVSDDVVSDSPELQIVPKKKPATVEYLLADDDEEGEGNGSIA